MTDNPTGEFFSRRHRQLMNLARAARITAWIIAVINIVSALALWLSDAIYPDVFHLTIYSFFNEMTLLYIFPKMIGMLASGALFWLVLQGISMILNILVETDLNYREAQSGGAHD